MMETNNKKSWTPEEKTKLKVFVLIAYGVTVVMGVLLGITQRMGGVVDAFPNAQMFYPAAGVMLAMMVTEKQNPLLPKRFYGFFMVLTALMVAICIGSVVDSSRGTGWLAALNVLIMVGSIFAWVFLLTEKKEKREAFGLRWHNTGASLLMILLFLALYVLRVAASVVLEPDGLAAFAEQFAAPEPYIMLAVLIPNFFLVFVAFFGEEYGWRYFLQPLMEKRFGPRLGTVLLGVAWGLWHLPLNLFFYSPETSLQSIVAQQVTCICLGIFFAFAYKKTGNIWVPVWLHYFNNNLIVVVTGSADISNQVYTWPDVLLGLVINAVVFLPFLASKVFRAGDAEDAGDAEVLS